MVLMNHAGTWKACINVTANYQTSLHRRNSQGQWYSLCLSCRWGPWHGSKRQAAAAASRRLVSFVDSYTTNMNLVAEISSAVGYSPLLPTTLLAASTLWARWRAQPRGEKLRFRRELYINFSKFIRSSLTYSPERITYSPSSLGKSMRLEETSSIEDGDCSTPTEVY